MLNSRRLSILLVAAAIVGAVPALLVPPPAPGQVQKVKPGFDDPFQPQPKQPDYKPGVKSSAIKLVENEEYQKTIDNALDAIDGGDYHDACEYLQAILENKEDVFVRVETIDPKTGAKKSHSVSGKHYANDLIAKFPPKGLETYELKFGAQAKQMLDQAKESGSREKLGEVAAKFGHTKAGAVASELLATTFMDRGEYVPAALAYMQLIGPDPAKTNVSDLVLFKATLAFKRAGDNKKSAMLWDVLQPRLKTNGGLLLANGQTVPIKQVQEALAQSTKVIASNPHDWPVIWGNLQHNAQAKGSQPMLDYVLWSRPIFRDKSEETGEEDPGIDAQRFFGPQGALESHQNDPNAALIPGGFPIAANGILFYRTYAGLAAVYLHDVYDKAGKLEAKAGSIHFKTPQFDGALGAAYSDKDKKIALDMWINNIYEKSRLTNLLFENSTVGTLTTDNRNVYTVDDLAVPIPPKLLNQNLQEPARSLVYHNKLRAYDISSGKIMWDLPGDPPKAEFKDSHFLCAPIAVGGKLYVLNEKNNGELRLLCLEPNTGKLLGAPQKLGTVRSDHLYFYDIARRVNAIHLAYAEGILVCPTNAGEIVGVDLLSQSLAWAYKYRDKPPNPQAFPGPNKQYDPNPYSAIALSYSNWKATPPVIVDGKVVFTAPDASAICCVNLRDGTELWAAPQHETDVYLAGVFLDKVLIVGKNSIRALKLSDGTPVGYPLQTGDMPSGQGVASNNVYYLPLRKGEICAIDIEHWSIKAHNRTNKAGAQAPGNLVFYEGLVISQTPTHIVAYPQLAAKLAEAEQAYTKDPNLKNLLNRGELRLADGQTQKAVDDLIAVLGKNPPEEIVPRTKNRLYEALGDLLQADFPNTADKYLKDFKELTKVPGNPAEQVKREAKYWRTVAHGREAQGNLVEAFLAYKEFGASPLFKDDGVPSLEDPLYKVPTHLWLRGRITAMFEKANAGQRGGLEKKIAEEWLAVVNKKNNIDAIRSFIGMFDVPFKVGREARLELANAIIKSKVQDAFLEAELNLQQLRVAVYRKDPEVGGKALEALARLEVAKGTEDALRLAAAYYGEINKQFPKDVLRDGKTGAELFQKLAEDPRLRAFLEPSAVNWSTTDLKFRELRGADTQGVLAVKGFVFQPEGDLSPQMSQHRLILNAETNQTNPELRFVDLANNKLVWSKTLPHSQPNFSFFNYIFSQNNNPTGFFPNAKFRFYQVKGHLAVIQVGMEAYGIDLGAGTILWQHSLYDPYKAQPNTNWSISMDEHGSLLVLHQNQFGNSTKARVGHIGSVQATYVALITQKGLVVLDPIKGTTLWTKPGLLTNTEIFGDDQHIYYVETAEGAAVGAGRCLRASDGAPVDVTDFGFFYRNKQRIFGGRQILTSEQNGKTVTMRLHDVPTGKEIWKRTFANDPAVLTTNDPHQCGVIERETGKLSLVDALTGQDIVVANMKQYRVSDADLKGLYQPVLVDDGEQFFVALNTKDNPNHVVNNTLSNNFSSFTPCLPVNGWLCCLDRKGEFQWHGIDRFTNQFIIVEQFKSLPILLFASRWVEQKDGSAYRKARAFSISKTDGSAIWSFERDGDGRPTYFSFNVDLKAGTVNMIGQDTSLFVHQHYLETKGDAKKGVVGPGGKDAGQPAAKRPPAISTLPNKIMLDPPPPINPNPPLVINHVIDLGDIKVAPKPPPVVPPPPPIKKGGLLDAGVNRLTIPHLAMLTSPSPAYSPLMLALEARKNSKPLSEVAAGIVL